MLCRPLQTEAGVLAGERLRPDIIPMFHCVNINAGVSIRRTFDKWEDSKAVNENDLNMPFEITQRGTLCRK